MQGSAGLLPARLSRKNAVETHCTKWNKIAESKCYHNSGDYAEDMNMTECSPFRRPHALIVEVLIALGLKADLEAWALKSAGSPQMQGRPSLER